MQNEICLICRRRGTVLYQAEWGHGEEHHWILMMSICELRATSASGRVATRTTRQLEPHYNRDVCLWVYVDHVGLTYKETRLAHQGRRVDHRRSTTMESLSPRLCGEQREITGVNFPVGRHPQRSVILLGTNGSTMVAMTSGDSCTQHFFV